MTIDLWRHEIRRAAWPALTPIVATVISALITAGSAQTSSDPQTVPYGLRCVLEMAIPLAVGVATSTLSSRDPVLEVQLTMPVAFRSTLMRRAVVILTAGALMAVITDLALRAHWTQDHNLPVGQLVWLAPALALGALGLLLGVVLRDPAAAGATVAVLWAFQVLAPHRVPRPLYLFASSQPFTGDWPVNRASLLGCATVLAALAWKVLDARAWLLTSAGAR